MSLTETTIRKLPTPEKPTLIADGRGLYLRATPSGKHSWQYRTRAGGQWRVVTIGQWPSVSLAAARQKASALSAKGDIPDACTFAQLLERWLEEVADIRYGKHAAKAAGIYARQGQKALGSVQLTQLSTARLVSALDAKAKAAPISANRCLTYWKLALDFAAAKGLIEHNPLARITGRTIGGPERSRDRVLTDDEICALMAHGLPFFKFLLMTGVRINEALEGHRDDTRWNVPDGLSKNGIAYWAHLPALAVEQMAEPWPWQRQNEYQEWLRGFCADQVEGVPFTPHDLRRTFRTRLAALGVAPHVAEKMIGHKLSGILAVYDRHDYAAERIAAAELWAEELERLAT